MHASKRAVGVVHVDFKSGLDSLATISSAAPFVGMFGTLAGIWESPQAIGTERMTAMANLFGRLSIACVPMAIGLFIGLVSHYAYRYLSSVLTFFDDEMATAVVQLVKDLTTYEKRPR